MSRRLPQRALPSSKQVRLPVGLVLANWCDRRPSPRAPVANHYGLGAGQQLIEAGKLKPAKTTNATPEPEVLESVKRAQRGEDAALEQLIRDYQRRVAGAVVALIGLDADWQDLCQQIFVKMVRGLPRLKQPELFEPWLMRIARNACFDHLRRRRARRFLVPWERWHDDLATPSPGPDPETRSAALARALERLPEDQRELLTLMRDGLWSYEALARLTGDSLAAIKSRLFRARRRVQQIMLEGESDEG
jgi:RNA polymerase sigma-70 factor (ECF subfamily)